MLKQLWYNPLVQYSLLHRRRDWRYPLAIGLTILGYAPLMMMIAYGLLLVVGFIFMLIFGLIALIYTALLDPPQAQAFINESLSALSQLWENLTVDNLIEGFWFVYTWVRNFLNQLLPGMGTFVFFTTSGFSLFLTMLFAPIFSANLISSERERQTLDFLLVTLLSEPGLLWGKVFPSILYTLMPSTFLWTLLMLCYAFGGVDLGMALITLLILWLTAITFTMIGLFTSTIARSVTGSLFLIYAVFMPALFIGPFMIGGIFEGLAGNTLLGDNIVSWLFGINPFIAWIASATSYHDTNGGLFWVTDKNGYPVIQSWIFLILNDIVFASLLFYVALWRVRKLSNG